MSGITRSDLGDNVKEKFMLSGGIAFRLADVMSVQQCVTYKDQVGSRDDAFEFDSGSTRFEAEPTQLTSLFIKPSRQILVVTISFHTLSNFTKPSRQILAVTPSFHTLPYFVIIRSNIIQQYTV